MASSSAPFVAGLLLVVQQIILVHNAGAALAFAIREEDTKKPPSLLVQSTCNSTTFYDLCVAALTADPSSSTADVPGLCAIAVSSAAANASATASFLLANATSSSSSSFVRSCAAKYANARDALLAARLSVVEQAYDYALLHVSAAEDYPTVCRTLFRRRQSPYPLALANREEGLRRLCTITLDIISLLLPLNK